MVLLGVMLLCVGGGVHFFFFVSRNQRLKEMEVNSERTVIPYSEALDKEIALFFTGETLRL